MNLLLLSSGIETAAKSTESRFFIEVPANINTWQTITKGIVSPGSPKVPKTEVMHPVIMAEKTDAKNV